MFKFLCECLYGFKHAFMYEFPHDFIYEFIKNNMNF